MNEDSQVVATPRPVALVTGASRTIGIGARVACRLAAAGWDVAITYCTRYDEVQAWKREDPGPRGVVEAIEAEGARAFAVEADLAEIGASAEVFEVVHDALGAVDTMVLNHCECEVLGLLDTTPEAMDRHAAVNVRANLLLIQEYARRFRGETGAIVALTSDHTAGNVPYGVTKGALERLITAAAVELAPQRIRANAVNPGTTDTGWMSADISRQTEAATPLGRVGTPDDAARLIEFLCSDSGQWITGQLFFSNGGMRMTTP